MTTKHFDAILAKNEIARQVRRYNQSGLAISPVCVRAALEAIETYIGQANQPSVASILDSERNDI